MVPTVSDEELDLANASAEDNFRALQLMLLIDVIVEEGCSRAHAIAAIRQNPN